MGRVIAEIKIMPQGLEVDLDALAGEVKKLGGHQITIKPVAFGLKAVHAVFSVEDGEGGTEPVERKLSSLPGVASVEVLSLGREITSF